MFELIWKKSIWFCFLKQKSDGFCAMCYINEHFTQAFTLCPDSVGGVGGALNSCDSATGSSDCVDKRVNMAGTVKCTRPQELRLPLSRTFRALYPPLECSVSTESLVADRSLRILLVWMFKVRVVGHFKKDFFFLTNKSIIQWVSHTDFLKGFEGSRPRFQTSEGALDFHTTSSLCFTQLTERRKQ